MLNEDTYLSGEALGSAALMGPLLIALVTRGILSRNDARMVVDRALLSMEERQARGGGGEIWKDARQYVESMLVAL